MPRLEPNAREQVSLHALARDVARTRGDPELSHRTLVDGIVKIIGGDCGLSLVAERNSPPRVIHWGGLRGGTYPWESASAVALEASLLRLENGEVLKDGGFSFAHAALARSQQFVAYRKRAWTVREWDAAAPMRLQRGLGSVDDILFAGFRAQWGNNPELTFGVSVYRMEDGGLRRPFGERHARLLSAFMSLRLDDFYAGEFGPFSYLRPFRIELTPMERACSDLLHKGLSQLNVALALEAKFGIVDRSLVYRTACGVCHALTGGEHRSPHHLPALWLPLCK